jgi:hypothetical protein
MVWSGFDWAQDPVVKFVDILINIRVNQNREFFDRLRNIEFLKEHAVAWSFEYACTLLFVANHVWYKFLKHFYNNFCIFCYRWVHSVWGRAWVSKAQPKLQILRNAFSGWYIGNPQFLNWYNLNIVLLCRIPRKSHFALSKILLMDRVMLRKDVHVSRHFSHP